LTVNLTLCTVVVLTSVTLGRSNFHVVQLLWINLIMDTLGAVAICTEPYQKRVFQAAASDKTSKRGPLTRRIRKSDEVIDAGIWRSILTQYAYQTFTLLILVYFGVFMFFGGETFNIVTQPLREKGGMPAGALVLDTIVFHTFVLMCLFNQINCRVI
jgi:Ca2+-transporting ATPase